MHSSFFLPCGSLFAVVGGADARGFLEHAAEIGGIAVSDPFADLIDHEVGFLKVAARAVNAQAREVILVGHAGPLAEQLADIGIWGDNLKEINTFSSLRYSPQTGYYVIYLDAEKIIKHMAEDPLDDEIKGTLSINAVYGEKDEAIRWAVTIDAGNGTGSVSKRPFNVTIDQIIATAR